STDLLVWWRPRPRKANSDMCMVEPLVVLATTTSLSGSLWLSLAPSATTMAYVSFDSEPPGPGPGGGGAGEPPLPAGNIRPIRLPSNSVNQRAPSGPDVIPI